MLPSRPSPHSRHHRRFSSSTEWDEAIDREGGDPAPGAQRFEKMAAGHYLGEIVRRAVRDVGRSSPIFQGWAGAFATPFAIDSVHLARIAGDESGDLAAAEALLQSLGVKSTLAERKVLERLAAAVARRAARMIAAALLGTLTFIDRDLAVEHTVAVDGSVYGGYPRFADMVRAGLKELTGPERASRLRLLYVKDSTAAGAAVASRF